MRLGVALHVGQLRLDFLPHILLPARHAGPNLGDRLAVAPNGADVFGNGPGNACGGALLLQHPVARQKAFVGQALLVFDQLIDQFQLVFLGAARFIGALDLKLQAADVLLHGGELLRQGLAARGEQLALAADRCRGTRVVFVGQ